MSIALEAPDLTPLSEVIGEVLEAEAGFAIPPFRGWINGELAEVVAVLQRVAVYVVGGDERACAKFSAILVDPSDIKPRPVRKRRQFMITSLGPATKERACSVCRGLFEPVKEHQLYCSERCRWRAAKSRGVKASLARRVRLCERCGVEFEAPFRNPNTRFCTERHQRDAFNEKRRQPGSKPRPRAVK